MEGAQAAVGAGLVAAVIPLLSPAFRAPFPSKQLWGGGAGDSAKPGATLMWDRNGSGLPRSGAKGTQLGWA